MGRMSEINHLKWQDVNLEQRYVILYTRKKKGGHRTPRKARILGHENRTTTEIYLHSIGDSARHALNVLNEGFGEFPRPNPTQMKKGYSPETITL